MANNKIPDNEISALVSLYETAIAQSNHEGDLIWQKFNGFIVTHSIFFFIIGQIITSDKLVNQHYYLFVLSIAGLILSFLWLISTARGYDALDYWQYSAIEIANKMFSPKKNKFKNYYEQGYKFFQKYEQASFNFGYEVNGEKEVKLPRSCLTCLFKLINTKLTAYLSIGLIMLIYFIVFVVSISGIQLNKKQRYEENTYFPQKRHIFFNNYH